jgi:hypothetical protein
MKNQEFRKLVREEIRKAIKEVDYQPSYTHMKPFKMEIAKMVAQLDNLNSKIEGGGPLSEEIADAIESLELLISNINRGR